MVPAVVLDVMSDFTQQKPQQQSNSTLRTLLLSPPSISSHPEALSAVIAKYDRSITDLQMLDRLSLGLVTLPDATFDLVLILTDADGSGSESLKLLTRDIFAKITKTLKSGGRLQSQDGKFAVNAESNERREAILAGLVFDGENGMVKPDAGATQSVPLRFGRKKEVSGSAATSQYQPVEPLLTQKRPIGSLETARPTGVGFVHFSDDIGKPIIDAEEDDDELIDEDTLLDADDLTRPIIQRESS
jgi:hypothetical protein